MRRYGSSPPMCSERKNSKGGKIKSLRVKKRIVIIGAGRVGTALAKALRDKDYDIVAVLSRSLESAKRCAQLCSCPLAITDAARIPEVDIVIISVPDDAIQEVAEGLRRLEVLHEGSLVVHTSGAIPSDVLSPLRELGADVASVHPIQSITGPESDIRGVYFGVEGDERALPRARRLVEDLGGIPLEIPEGEKSVYHLACTIASNYLVTLLHVANRLFESLGLEPGEAFKVLKPLIEGTLANVEKLGVEEALTGPISRGDIGTVRGHLEVLKERFPHLIPFYVTLGRLTTEMAKSRGSIDRKKAAALERLFKSFT